MTKPCKRCGVVKPLDAFSAAPSNKDGHINTCKPCVVVRNREYWRTAVGRISNIYASQGSSSKERQHPPPTYSRQELTAWAIQNGLDNLMVPWVASGYKQKLAPSVDRLDPNKGYSLGNIRLVTWAENNSKAYGDRKSCLHVTTQCRKIRQLTLDGVLVREFASISAAARETKLCRTAINYVCKGTYVAPHLGGFLWEYAL